MLAENYDSSMFYFEDAVVFMNSYLIKHKFLVDKLKGINNTYNINTKHTLNRTIIIGKDIYRLDICQNLASVVPYIRDTEKTNIIESIKKIERYLCYGIKLRNYTITILNHIGFKLSVYSKHKIDKIDIEGYRQIKKECITTLVGTPTSNKIGYIRRLYFDVRFNLINKKTLIPQSIPLASLALPLPLKTQTPVTYTSFKSLKRLSKPLSPIIEENIEMEVI